MIKDKMKALFTLGGYTQKMIAESKGILPQQLQNKMRMNSFKISELIEIGDQLGFTLAFLDKNDNPVIKFDMNDIKKAD